MENKQGYFTPSLNGKRVFVVEDEPILTMMLEIMLADLGAEMSASASSVAAALDMARTGEFDCAILDVNVGSEKSYAVAELLAERGIPFVFATGGGDLDDQFKQTPIVHKPFVQDDLEAAILDLFGAN